MRYDVVNTVHGQKFLRGVLACVEGTAPEISKVAVETHAFLLEIVDGCAEDAPLSTELLQSMEADNHQNPMMFLHCDPLLPCELGAAMLPVWTSPRDQKRN